MIKQFVDDFFKTSKGNFIQVNQALNPQLIGMKIFDEPIIGFANANDSIFEMYSDRYKIMYSKRDMQRNKYNNPV